MNALTDRQKAVLAAIRQSVEARGYPPSIRELNKAVGLVSESSVTHQLRALQEKGYIIRELGRSRAIRVLDSQETTR